MLNKIEDCTIEIYHKYFDQYFVLMPFFVSIGVIIFVSSSLEISLYLMISLLCIALFGYLISTYFWRIIIMPFIMVVIGVLVASFYSTMSQKQNYDCSMIKNIPITVKIDRIVYGVKSYIFGNIVSMKNIPVNCRVKLNYLEESGFRLNDIKSGDTINFIGSVYASQPPIYPRIDKTFIEKLSGKLLLVKVKSDVKLIKTANIGFFDRIRANIAEKINILSDHGKKSGYGIVAALTIGNTGYIDENVLDNIRKSGFAHLLAISGLHLGTIISLIFVLIRWILSFIPYICLRYNTKKIAAVVAILVSFCYLQIANGSISVQRSFIMCGLLLVGVIVDRKAIMLRIWGVALFYVVILMPDKIFMPSMQMSFVATFTLIAVYQKFSKTENTLILTNKNGLLFYIFTIFLSSFIAGFTTMFYEAYHFGQWSMIGLVSNELAIPVTEFLLLPLSMIAILFTDTWIGDYIYNIAGFLGDILAYLANFFANQKFSYILLKAMPPSSILLITIGLYIVFVTLNKWSLIGGFFIIVAVVLHYFAPKPIFLIDSRGEQIVYLANDNKYYVNKNIEHPFVKRIFSQELAQKDFTVENNSSNWSCNDGLCRYKGIKEICVLETNINRVSLAKNMCPDAVSIVDLRKNTKKDKNIITKKDLRKNGTFVYVS